MDARIFGGFVLASDGPELSAIYHFPGDNHEFLDAQLSIGQIDGVSVQELSDLVHIRADPEKIVGLDDLHLLG